MNVYLIHEDTEEDVIFKSKEKAFEYFYSLIGEDEIENKDEVEEDGDYPYGYNKYGNFIYMAEAELRD